MFRLLRTMPVVSSVSATVGSNVTVIEPVTVLTGAVFDPMRSVKAEAVKSKVREMGLAFAVPCPRAMASAQINNNALRLCFTTMVPPCFCNGARYLSGAPLRKHTIKHLSLRQYRE